MKLRFFLIGLMSIWGLNVNAQSGYEAMGVVTGSITGTYIKFGENMAEVATQENLNLLIKESEGSLANIERMVSRENAGAGIVQSDVLGFLSRSTDPKSRKVAERLRLIFPFYNEEVHLYAQKSINTIQDLQGKRVIVGTTGSGNWLTATNLLHLMGVEPAERLELDPVAAATAVLTGEADAMFYVAGKPVKLFKNLEQVGANQQYAALVQNVHMVPLNDPKILNEYVSASLTPGDYSWLSAEVPTVAVKAVLVGFDFSSKRSNYYRQRCSEFAKLGKAIRNNIDYLKTNGHPKWNEVNLDEELGLWQRDKCSAVEAPKPAPAPAQEKTDGFLIKELEKCITTGEC